MSVSGYIILRAPKRQTDFCHGAPMAYGVKGVPGHDDRLLVDRGATLFATYEAATTALESTLTAEESAGHLWPKKYSYEIVEVRVPPEQ